MIRPRRSIGRRFDRRHKWRYVAVLSTAAIACMFTAPIAAAQATKNAHPRKTKSSTSSFNLAQLVSEAQAEGGTLQVWDSSSSITQIAQDFTSTYNIKVTATKVSATTELTKLQALQGNPNPGVDVVLFATGPQLATDLVPQGIVKSWVPPNLDIPKTEQNPLVYLYQPTVFYFDPAIWGKSCPITNIWQLTTPTWRGKVAMDDPTQTPEVMEWFAEMAINGRNQLASAYQQQFHKPYKGTNAGYTFIEDLAKNAPIIASSLDTAIEAAGGPGVTKANAAIAMAHGATYADAPTDDTDVAMCRSIYPWDGYLYPKFIVETTNTHLPYEAELFTYYAETAAGNAPAAAGGGESGNIKVPGGTGGPPGLLDVENDPSKFFRLRIQSLAKDQALVAPLTELWLENLATP